MTLPKTNDELNGWPDGWTEQPDHIGRRAAHYETAYADACQRHIRLQVSHTILTERFEALAAAYDRLRAEYTAHMAWNGTADAAYDAVSRDTDPLTHRYAAPAAGESPASSEWFEDPRGTAAAAGAESDPAVREPTTQPS